MNRFLPVLFFSFITFGVSAEENNTSKENNPISNLFGAPSAVAGGCVNVITGDFFVHEVDTVIKGAEPLVLSRSYSSSDGARGSLCYGWHINHFGKITLSVEERKKGDSKLFAELTGENGSKILYRKQKKLGDKYNSIYTLSTKMVKGGMTNLGQGAISARTSLYSHTFTIPKDKRKATICNGDGTRWLFRKRGEEDNLYIRNFTKLRGFDYRFFYGDDNEIHRVDLFNINNQKIAGLLIDRPRHPSHSTPEPIRITCSDGKKVSYNLTRESAVDDSKLKGFFLKSVDSNSTPSTSYTYKSYHYDAEKRSSHIVALKRADNRYMNISYYAMGKNCVGGREEKIKDYKDQRLGRVLAISSPVGSDGTAINTYSFIYEKLGDEGNNGTAIVFDAYNQQTNYTFENKRLKAIDYFKGYGSNYLYSKQKYFWSDKGELISSAISNALDWTQACHYQTYDARGNIVEERLYGNLSGRNQALLRILPSGCPDNTGCEFHAIRYTYTSNNLVDEEIHHNKTIKRIYNSKDLITAQYTYAAGLIRERSFYFYDANSLLVKEIDDDGISPDPQNMEGVTQRLGKTIIPSQIPPYGLPVEVVNWYWDAVSHSEKRLSRVINSYNVEGLLVRRDQYDSEDRYIGCEEWEYDCHGNILKTVDVFGNAIAHSYDQNDNLIASCGPLPGQEVHYTYDYSNRLISKKQLVPDEESLVNTYQYTLTNRLHKESDFYGNIISYSYDHRGMRTHTRYPPVLTVDDTLIEYSKVTHYDLLGHTQAIEDSNGNITLQEATIRGAPHKITYADGAIEHNYYHLDGALLCHTANDGTTTHTKYDYQKRPVEMAIVSKEGVCLSKTIKRYNSFHLISETDNGNNETLYEYDGAGRLTTVSRGKRKSTYSYDSRGNRDLTCEWLSNDDFIATRHDYDLLNRIVAERIEDSNGALQSFVEYRYDPNGNRTHTICHTDKGPAITLNEYDTLSRIIKSTDPEGNCTHIRYFKHYHSTLGQFIAATETTDPRGVTTLQLQDAMGRSIETLRRDPFGTLLQRNRTYYDGNGNIIQQIADKIEEGNILSQQIRRLTYDKRNNLVSATQAYGTTDERTVNFNYDLMGRKSCYYKADGTKHHYIYDPLGRLTRHVSSDGTIDYRYEYDLLDHPIAVHDALNGTVTLRCYDLHGSVTTETLANGFKMSYSYDSVGRITSIILPDGSKLSHYYRGKQLLAVDKHDNIQCKVFNHQFLKYDLSGKLLAEKGCGSSGITEYSYDLMGRIRSISHPHWKETLDSYDSSGNLLARTISDSSGIRQESYAYDFLHQLKEEAGPLFDHTYGHDSLYNRRHKDQVSYALNALNQIVQTHGVQYDYDRDGNIIAENKEGVGISYQYDALDRLVAIINGNCKTEYNYDPFNRRLAKYFYIKNQEKWQPHSQHSYLYQHQNEIAQIDQGGIFKQFRLLGCGLGAEIGAALTCELSGRYYVPLHDHNGNVVCLLDQEAGNVVEYYRYSAYGEELIYNLEGSLLPAECALMPWRFSSKRYDPESGWVFFGRRHYNPLLGRWTTADPAGYRDGSNLYAYVHNNPLTHFDLYGLFDSMDSNDYWDAFNAIQEGRRYPIECIGRGIEIGLRGYGYVVESIAHHCMPSSTVRTSFKGVGRLMQGQTLFDPNDSITIEHGFVGERQMEGVRLAYKSGIMTYREGCMATAEFISEAHDHARVLWILRPSKGALNDGIDAFLGKIGISHAGCEEEAAILRDYYNECKQEHGRAELAMYLSSRAAIDTKNILPLFSKEMCFDTSVATFGGAYMFPSTGLKKAVNYTNPDDSIPLTDFFSRFRKNVTIIDTGYSSGRGIVSFDDHYMESEGYRESVKRLGQEVLRREREFSLYK